MLSHATKSRVYDVAAVLAECTGRDTLADVLNCLLGAEAEPRLTAYQVELADCLLESLASLRPDAHETAVGELAPARNYEAR